MHFRNHKNHLVLMKGEVEGLCLHVLCVYRFATYKVTYKSLLKRAKWRNAEKSESGRFKTLKIKKCYISL